MTKGVAIDGDSEDFIPENRMTTGNTFKDDTAKDDKPKKHNLNSDPVDYDTYNDDTSKIDESGVELPEGDILVSERELSKNHPQKALKSTHMPPKKDVFKHCHTCQKQYTSFPRLRLKNPFTSKNGTSKALRRCDQCGKGFWEVHGHVDPCDIFTGRVCEDYAGH